MTMNDKDRKNISHHILPISANLLGLCFLILSLKKLWKADGVERFVDKLDGVAIIVFLVASVISYMSIRAKERSELYERIADLIFLAGLFLLTLIAAVTVLEIR
jgi:hypothetical protein